MDLWSDVERVLATINRELDDAGDKARIRFMHIKPTPMTIANPWFRPSGSSPTSCPVSQHGPLDTLDYYINMVDRHFADSLSDRFVDTTTSMCWFRTRDELEEYDDGRPVYRTGRPVRELAQLS